VQGCLGPYKLDGIYVGDAKELAKEIPDKSVDLIFTDPVYQNFDDYRWLAQEANRILKPGAALLTFFGIGYAEETLKALREGGRKVTWIMPIYQPGQTRRIHPKCFCHWYGLLWAGGKPYKTFVDVQVSHTGTLVGKHKWRKNPIPIAKYIDAFTKPGDVVVDFFCGGGAILAACKALGRHYLGFEIDPESANLAKSLVGEAEALRAKLSNAQGENKGKGKKESQG